MPRITFFYDVVSPWSVFAFHTLKRYERVWNLDIIYKPRYLGGVMVASGNQPPANNPSKGTADLGSIHDCASSPRSLLTTGYVQFPSTFPINTIHIARLLRVIEDEAPSALEPITALFFNAMWSPNADANFTVQPKNFAAVIPAEILSRADLEKYLKMSQTDVNKERMKVEAAALVAEGAFGFPWLQVENDAGKKASFFGSDRFELIAFFLGRSWLGPFPEGGRPSKL
ncbi:glutathione S-transferase kappa 1, partial [Phenoliferia sp. Uapishka_3]